MDIIARLQQIEELIQEAKSMPLSASVLVNREELLELLEAARTELPEEIKQARWIVKDREELLSKGRRDAEAIVERGQHERSRLISAEEVVIAAQEEADRIVSEAREQARPGRHRARGQRNRQRRGHDPARLAQRAREKRRDAPQVERHRRSGRH